MNICIASNKGGVCKTSVATNLGAILSKDNMVLIVDADGQDNCSLAFGINPKNINNSLHDVLIGDCEIEEAMIEINKNLTLVPAGEDMNFLEFETIKNENFKRPFEILKPHLDKVKSKYDYIFLDTPPSLGLVTGNCLMASDKVIIPFELELFAIKGLIKVLETVKQFQSRNIELEVAGVLAVKTDLRTSLHSDMLQQARKYCAKHKINIFETVIPRSIRFASATNYSGKPAVWVDEKNPLVKSYYDLVKEVF